MFGVVYDGVVVVMQTSRSDAVADCVGHGVHVVVVVGPRVVWGLEPWVVYECVPVI